MINDVCDKQLLSIWIDEYMNLQRILVSDNRDAEIEYQLKTVKAKLNFAGIATSNLDLKEKS